MKLPSLRTTFRETTWNAIVDATEQVAARDGLLGANLQAIAERAGVAVGTIYNYFEDKDELLDALFAHREAELFTAIDTATKQQSPFAEQLGAFVLAMFRFYDVRRHFLRVTLEAERLHATKGTTDMKASGKQRLHERAERIMCLGIREERLDGDDAGLLAAMLVGAIRGVTAARADDERPFAVEAERVVGLFLRGAAK
jgi:AcrR family transcriptional regulator